jgi:hypothetical protein
VLINSNHKPEPSTKQFERRTTAATRPSNGDEDYGPRPPCAGQRDGRPMGTARIAQVLQPTTGAQRVPPSIRRSGTSPALRQDLHESIRAATSRTAAKMGQRTRSRRPRQQMGQTGGRQAHTARTRQPLGPHAVRGHAHHPPAPQLPQRADALARGIAGHS